MKLLNDIWSWKPLQGKKTVIAAILLVVISGLKAQGYIGDELYITLMGLLTALGLGAAAVHKVGK